jgi:hypothetical protein
MRYLMKCDAKLQEQKLFGIVKGIPLDYDVSLFVGCEGVVDAKRIGQSLTVKVFSTRLLDFQMHFVLT